MAFNTDEFNFESILAIQGYNNMPIRMAADPEWKFVPFYGVSLFGCGNAIERKSNRDKNMER